MPSTRPRPSDRRRLYLKLSHQIESQLRDAYAKLHDTEMLNQASYAKKLGVSRSVINRRLSGRTNMTIETIADMAWGLGQDVDVQIFDPKASRHTNFFFSDASEEFGDVVEYKSKKNSFEIEPA